MKTIQRISLSLFGVAAVAALGCEGTADVPSDPQAINLAGLTTVSQLRAELGAEALLEDTPAQRSYEDMERIFAGDLQSALALPVYALEPAPDAVTHLSRRAGELGLRLGEITPTLPSDDDPARGDNAVADPSAAVVAAPTFQEQGDRMFVQSGDWELSINRASGAERFVNRALMHSAAGVEALPLTSDAYLTRAQEHARNSLPAGLLADLHPYKTRRYMNATKELNGGPESTSIYQVAIAFNTDVNGIAVIGAGSKLAVHMDPTGAVLSHENSVRGRADRLAIVGGNALRSPQQARDLVEARLTGRGVDLTQFELVDAQFGYFRRGRSGVQDVLAPAYAYFYSPLDGVTGKRLIEVVSAVSDHPIASQIDADETAEDARKAVLRNQTADSRQ